MPVSVLIALCINMILTDAVPYSNEFGMKCNSTPNCRENRCIIVSFREICTQCNEGYVPLDGICADDASVIKAFGCTVSDGRCTSCKGDNYFLFYGGCHNTEETAFNVFCAEVKDGKCTKCKGITFTNPEPNAAELCILCMDTVGFGNHKGREGCTHCFMTDIAGTDPFVCAGCSDPQLVPIDGTCRDKGTHECRNGHCSACAVTHIFFKYGCYDRYGSIAQRYICKAENQFELGNRVCCRKCVDPLFFINNGACVSEAFMCEQRSGEVCTKCNSKIPTIFLFGGGCYEASKAPGNLLCSKASDGKCTNWTCDQKGVTKLGDDCIFCDDSKGSVGCTECKGEGDKFACVACKDGLYRLVSGACACTIDKCKKCAILGSSPVCLECEGMFSLDQKSCVTECPPGQKPDEKKERCQCSEGTVPKSDWSGCEHEENCPASAVGCSKCSSSGKCVSCISNAEYVSPGQTRRVSFCPDGSQPLGQRCICAAGLTPSNDECIVRQKNKAGLSTQAIAGIAVAGTMTLGALAGVLVWLFVFRRKQ